MSGSQYLALGYTIALGLMWGSALLVYLKSRRLARRGGAGTRTVGPRPN
ncbi:MAG: hypothetical protein KDA22_13470 [Phycisphaerales bacterium]|nr:hypothetical protein [Phycisphaerales bacterium]